MANPLQGGDVKPRAYISHEVSDASLGVTVSDGVLSITPFENAGIEVLFTPLNASVTAPSYARRTGLKGGAIAVEEGSATLKVKSGDVEVVVQKDPFRISFFSNGRFLLEEGRGLFADGASRGAEFRLQDDERLFGGGSRALGKMDRRGSVLPLYNAACYDYEFTAHQMYYGMPAVVSSRKYMLVFDNAARGQIDLDSTGDGRLVFSCEGGRSAYLVMAGDSWPSLAESVAEVTGYQPMLPRWALGLISSRMGYISQEQVESVVDAYQEAEVPLDAMVLDLYWFGPDLRGYMGNLDWDRKHFPEPESMIRKLDDQGVKTILITEPYVLHTSTNYLEASAAGVLAMDDNGQDKKLETFFGEAGLIDVFNPASREWFWQFYKFHTESGVAGWWGDLGEPETHPDDIIHRAGRGIEVHNAFGHEWARLVYEGFKQDFPEQRVFNLMRAGFVGTQRYGILPWSGDVKRSWGGLVPQPEISLQMGLQGIGWMHSDLGGFAGDYKDRELYIRWMQYGVFQPVYRPHGHGDVPPEPVLWDQETMELVRESVRLRYRLLPYNYTLMYENAVFGLPPMRPLMYLDSSLELENCVDTYLWGDAFLVAPVLKKGQKRRTVPLPAGSAWYDFWTGKRFDGGRRIRPEVHLDRIPVFVKAGSFIPTANPMQHTGEYDPARLQVHYYHDRDVTTASGQLYDDDGITPGAHEKKQYELLQFSADADPHRLTISVDTAGYDYPGRPKSRRLEFVVHGLATNPEEIEVEGQPFKPGEGSMRDGKLYLPVNLSGRAIKLVLRFAP